MNNKETTIGYYEPQKIAELLIGHKVTQVSEDTLQLDNGTLLRFEGNEGGCSCGAGDYDLTELNDTDNIITNVEFLDAPSDDYENGEGYKIFVFADNKKVNLASFEGTDGNGYYGTGYYIHVLSASEE